MAKNCPSCGYHEADNQSLYCNKCGYPFPPNPSGKPSGAAVPGRRPAPAAMRPPRRKNADAAAFLSFDILITRDYLRLIYIIGAVMVVLVSLMGIAGMFGKPAAKGVNVSITNPTAIAQDPAGSPLFWIGFLVVGSILWRMFCELFIVLSRLQEPAGGSGGAIPVEETGQYGEEYPAAPVDEGLTQYTECPKCSKIVPVDELRECEHCGVQGCSNCIRSMGLLKKTMTCRECFEAK